MLEGEVFKVFPVDSSTASAVEQTFSQAPHRFVATSPGSWVVKVFPDGQGSTASAVEQTIAVDRLQGFPRGQSSTASAVEQTIGVDRGGLQGFPRGQSSTASAVEQTFSQAPHRSLPRAPVHGRHDEWVCVVDVENDGEILLEPAGQLYVLAAAEGSQASLVLAPLWPLQGCRVASGPQGTFSLSILFRRITCPRSSTRSGFSGR